QSGEDNLYVSTATSRSRYRHRDSCQSFRCGSKPSRTQGSAVGKIGSTKAVAGGVTFPTPMPIEKCFDAVLNHLKRRGHEIDLADREAGRIATVMEVAGGHSQTGTRVLATLIEDSDSQASVRVAVTAQKRKKLLVTEPWSDPKVDESESAKAAAEME